MTPQEQIKRVAEAIVKTGHDLALTYTYRVAPEKTADHELDEWIVTVDREARRRTMVERAAASQRRGLLALSLRFFFKVMEIGPIATIKLSWAVLSGRIRQR